MDSISVVWFFYFSIFCFSCTLNPNKVEAFNTKYVPQDLELFNKIVSLDKELFDAYNTCDVATQDSLISEDLEFYHDLGGLMTSKQDLLEALKNNICGKVTRTLIEGSNEVYRIQNYGAVQMGMHKFYNKEEPIAESKPSKFITIWKNENEQWKVTRVVSLH